MSNILKYLLWLHVITVIFIILKVSHVIDWNWVWVFIPTIIDVVLNYFIIVLIDLYQGWIYNNTKNNHQK